MPQGRPAHDPCFTDIYSDLLSLVDRRTQSQTQVKVFGLDLGDLPMWLARSTVILAEGEAVVRTHLRSLRRGAQAGLAPLFATYEPIVYVKRVRTRLIRRM